jgi:murein endopeptidase
MSGTTVGKSECACTKPTNSMRLGDGSFWTHSRDGAWLTKVRPWWGHYYHFHVRIACPPESGDCRAQPPVPRGDARSLLIALAM